MTSAGTSTPNPAGGDVPVVDPPAPGEVPEVQAVPPSAPFPTPSPVAVPGTPTEEAPNRPGLETPQPTPSIPDPFVLIDKWDSGNSKKSLRAKQVPGGCLVRIASLFPSGAQFTESICFVPGVKIENGTLVQA